VDTFGESAPAGALFKHFGLTALALAELVNAQLAEPPPGRPVG
jgi:transketolase